MVMMEKLGVFCMVVEVLFVNVDNYLLLILVIWEQMWGGCYMSKEVLFCVVLFVGDLILFCYD